MNPKTIDLMMAILLAVVGVTLSVACLTWAARCAIWFASDFENEPDLVMERVVELSVAILLGFFGHYCIKRAVQVWQSIP